MDNANLYHQLYQRFSIDLSAPCLELPDGTCYSYNDLDNWSGGMAATLAQLGAAPGDRVVVQVSKSPAAVALYLACLRGGFVLVPLNTAYTSHELEYFIGDATPAIVVCDPARVEEISILLPPATTLVSLGWWHSRPGSAGPQRKNQHQHFVQIRT